MISSKRPGERTLALFAGNTASPESSVAGYHRYFPVNPISRGNRFRKESRENPQNNNDFLGSRV